MLPSGTSLKVRFIKNLKQTVKDQEMMALGTVQEIYDFLMENRRKEAEENNLSFFNHSY